MKQLIFKQFQLLFVVVILVFSIQQTNSQNTKNMTLKTETTVSAIEFQKKYVKHLKEQFKLNRSLQNLLEKELKKNKSLKDVRSIKSQLKKSNASLNATKKYIGQLENSLSSIGDDAQLANIELQNMLQKQQQTLQTMSNVSKMLHDTAKAIIRKIG